MTDSDGSRSSSARGTSAPNALSFENYSFNFRVDLAARIAASMGAPAFAQRRARLTETIEGFWAGVQGRHAALQIAADEGRIGVDGREIRQALLHSDGTDPLAAREHRRRLFSDKVDPEVAAREDFTRAWRRYVDQLDYGHVAAEVAEFLDWFPVEASMPLDPETQRYLWMGEPWEPPQAPTAADVYARFPLP